MTLGALVATEKLKGVGARSTLPTVKRICEIFNIFYDENDINENELG